MSDKWFDQESALLKFNLSLILMHLPSVASEAVQELLIAYEVKKQELLVLKQQNLEQRRKDFEAGREGIEHDLSLHSPAQDIFRFTYDSFEQYIKDETK